MHIVKEQKKPKTSIDSVLNNWITIELKMQRWVHARINHFERRKAEKKAVINAETYAGLHNLEEQRKLIVQFNMIQAGKGNVFGRKHKELIENKISYMIRNKIIQVEI
jgi:hypothetical protein